MDLSDSDIGAFVKAVKNGSGYDFSDYTYKSLSRRLAKIIQDRATDLEVLLEKISSIPAFAQEMVWECTIGTTELFRDPPVWKKIRNEILQGFKPSDTLNIWHAGCSTGQEAYSMMMLLHRMELLGNAQITATDLNPRYLEQARQGCYKYRYNLNYLDNFDAVLKEDPADSSRLLEIPYEDYMEINQLKDTLVMKEFLRDKPGFVEHDLVRGVSLEYKPFDLILCRNVIIYFNFELQNRVLRLLYDQLKPGGYLVLGAHESILGTLSEKFTFLQFAYRKN